MAYNLNIVEKDKVDAQFILGDIITRLQTRDSEVSIFETHGTITELRVPNFSIGKLYFSNGLIWSIFESIEQQQNLIEFFQPIGLSVIGEEGEVYFVDEKGSVRSIQKPEVSHTHRVNLLRIWNQRKLSVFIILMFGVAGWILGNS